MKHFVVIRLFKLFEYFLTLLFKPFIHTKLDMDYCDMKSHDTLNLCGLRPFVTVIYKHMFSTEILVV